MNQNQSPRVIHLEGMDLSGKSTVTAGLADRFPNAEIRRNSMIEHNPVFEVADTARRASASDPNLDMLYVGALAYDIARYVPPATELRVQDSTVLLRSVAHNEVRGNSAIVEALLGFADVHPRFDVSIVLTADLETRRDRLEMRKANAPHEVADDDLMVWRNPSLFCEQEDRLIFWAKTFFNAVILDTSTLNPSEVLAKAIELAGLNNVTDGKDTRGGQRRGRLSRLVDLWIESAALSSGDGMFYPQAWF